MLTVTALAGIDDKSTEFLSELGGVLGQVHLIHFILVSIAARISLGAIGPVTINPISMSSQLLHHTLQPP